MIIEESTFYTRPGWSTCFNIHPDDMSDAMQFAYEEMPVDVRDWLEEHIEEDEYEAGMFTIEFKNKEDATLFLLKWS
jgi:hypothetical protein